MAHAHTPTSRGHERHRRNLDRLAQPIPDPGKPPSSFRLQIALSRAIYRRSADGRIRRQRGGYSGRHGAGSIKPYRKDRERAKGRRAKMSRRRNRR